MELFVNEFSPNLKIRKRYMLPVFFLNRSGESRAQTKFLWILQPTESFMEETVTSSCTTTTMEDAKDTSSTCGEETSEEET